MVESIPSIVTRRLVLHELEFLVTFLVDEQPFAVTGAVVTTNPHQTFVALESISVLGLDYLVTLGVDETELTVGSVLNHSQALSKRINVTIGSTQDLVTVLIQHTAFAVVLSEKNATLTEVVHRVLLLVEHFTILVNNIIGRSTVIVILTNNSDTVSERTTLVPLSLDNYVTLFVAVTFESLVFNTEFSQTIFRHLTERLKLLLGQFLEVFVQESIKAVNMNKANIKIEIIRSTFQLRHFVAYNRTGFVNELPIGLLTYQCVTARERTCHVVLCTNCELSVVSVEVTPSGALILLSRPQFGRIGYRSTTLVTTSQHECTHHQCCKEN